MAFKQFVLDEHTTVTIYKRKASRSLRLSIAPGGQIRVSIPVWAPYSSGLNFAKSRANWIQAQQRPTHFLTDGQVIGKAHHLKLVADPSSHKPTSRVKSGQVIVTYPPTLGAASPTVQKLIQTASIRALRAQAEHLLPQRLANLAVTHGFSYHSVSIKQLRSRWGSCDHHQNIVLNLFLMQLPWEYIDYVLLHELTHTQVLHHGRDFWQAMERVSPRVKLLRKEIRAYQPIMHGTPPPAVA